MHILQCYKTALPLSMGGVEQVMHHISSGLVAQGHQATILAFAPQAQVQEIAYHGYKIIVVPASKEIASMPISLAGFKHFKSLSKIADVVHYHYPFPWMDLMHLVHPHSKPCLMTYHADIVKQKNLLKLYRPLQHYFLNRMTAIVATSPHYMESSMVLQKNLHKVTCIPLGLDEQHYRVTGPLQLQVWKQKLPERFLAFVGVFRYYKGLQYLFEALAGLDCPLVLIGGGPEHEQLLALQAKYQLKNVIFLGKLDDENKNMVLSLSSGVILPSHLRSEAFGLSLLEGAMFAKPLISCEISTGTSYINQDGLTGWVVKPKDIRSLRNALLDWHNSPAKALQFGTNARARFLQLFQAQAMVDNYIKLYNSII